jgi:hypothetical protein
LEQSGGVGDAPVLDDLAVLDMADRDPGEGGVLAAVGAPRRPARCDPVPVNHLVIDLDFQIWEDGAVHAD